MNVESYKFQGWTGQPENDWEEDSSHENGNYWNTCSTCGLDFLGHKRRFICRKCQKEADTMWEAKTEEEKQEHLAKVAEELKKWNL